MPGLPFGLGGLLGSGPVPDVQMPDGLPVAGGKGSPLVDAYLALQGQRIKDAVTAPRDAYSGDLQVLGADGHPTPEAMDRANGMAGLAMTGSLPMKAPAGAIRSFGGAAEKHTDDPLAALEAALTGIKPEAPAPGPRLLDPNAKAWDVYHGSGAGPDFARFDPSLANNPAERGAVFFAPDAETASGYASGSGAGAPAGPRVFRATVEPGKTDVFDIGRLAETDPAFNARAREIMTADSPGHAATFDNYMDSFRASRADDARVMQQMRDMGVEPDPNFGTRISYGHGHIGAAIERAKAQGLDTAILRGLVEHGGDDQVVALTPGRVRSYYSPDHVLYSGGPAGSLAGLPALAASSDPKGSPVSAGLSPFGAMTPAEIARLMQQARPMEPQADEVPAATPPGFSGFVPPSAPTMQPQASASPAPLPLAPAPPPQAEASTPRAPAPLVPSPATLPSLIGQSPPAMPQPVPPAPARSVAAAPSEDEADKPAANAMPAQGRAPLSIAPPTAPAPPAATATAQPSDGFDFGGALDRFKKNGGFDTLGNIGIGLMSTRGFGPGLAAGLKLDQDSGVKRAATDLARAEFGLKAQKAAQEQRALTGNAQYVMGKIPGISADQAVTLGSNSAFMNDLFKGILPPTELYKQYADKDGNIWNQNARTGQATVALKADEDKTQRPLTDPAERAKYGIAADDTKPYQVDANNRVSAIGGGGTSVSVDLGKKAAGEADAQILKKIDTSYDKAQGALGTLAAIGRQKQAIDRGIISGWGADWQTQARAMAGKLLGLSDEDVSNSQAFEGAAASKSAELAKAISQAGHTTNMDLQLGKTIAGGDRSKTEAAIRQIIDAQELLAKDTIAHHNAGVDRYVGASPDMKDRMGWYHVETPDVYRYGQGTPNPVADPGSAPPPTTREIGGKTYSKGPDGRWYEGK